MKQELIDLQNEAITNFNAQMEANFSFLQNGIEIGIPYQLLLFCTVGISMIPDIKNQVIHFANRLQEDGLITQEGWDYLVLEIPIILEKQIYVDSYMQKLDVEFSKEYPADIEYLDQLQNSITQFANEVFDGDDSDSN